MPTLRSHTHLQATQAHAQPKLTNKYACPTAQTDQRTTEKNNEGITAPWQKSGFCDYIKFNASNKLLWWLDSFELLSPLLRQAANRYTQLKNSFIYKHKHHKFFDVQASTSNILDKTLTLYTSTNYTENVLKYVYTASEHMCDYYIKREFYKLLFLRWTTILKSSHTKVCCGFKILSASKNLIYRTPLKKNLLSVFVPI